MKNGFKFRKNTQIWTQRSQNFMENQKKLVLGKLQYIGFSPISTCVPSVPRVKIIYCTVKRIEDRQILWCLSIFLSHYLVTICRGSQWANLDAFSSNLDTLNWKIFSLGPNHGWPSVHFSHFAPSKRKCFLRACACIILLVWKKMLTCG